MPSLATIFRQVEREGARWGLVPVMRNGKVGVAQRVPSIPRHKPTSTVTLGETLEVICSLDENSPMDAFAAILRHRLGRQHADFMKMVRRRQERLKAAERRENEQRYEDLRRQLDQRINREGADHRIMVFGAGR